MSSSTTRSAGPPGTRRPTPSTTEHTGRDGGRRVQCRFERNAELAQVPNGVDHRQHAACQDAVCPSRDAVPHGHVHGTEGVGPVTEPCARDRVGDEGDASARGSPHEPNDIGVEVNAIHDRLHDDVAPGKRGAHDPRVAVGERAHGVEDVGHGPGAAVEGGMRLGGRGIAVSERDDDVAGEQEVDQVEGARKLGCEGHHPDRPGR